MKETKAEKKTKGEKENSSSPILYNVILAISEEMVGRRANLKALLFQGISEYSWVSKSIPEYLRISKGKFTRGLGLKVFSVLFSSF